jgi:type I restriction enzyme, S subunit
MKPGYKQTEVGVIPEEWEVLPFEKLAHIERGKFTARPRNDPKYYGGDIPFIQTGDVTNANGEITTYSQTLNLAGLRVSKLFPRGTLFFTIAANIGDVGFAAFDTACPDSLVAISPSKSTDKKWLAYELAKRKSSFEGIATHNAQLNINLEKLRPYLLPHPPLPEQRAIAEALNDVDSLLGGLDRLIAKKRDLRQAAMYQLLNGRTRLPGFHNEWKVAMLGNLLTMKATYGIVTAGRFKSAGVPMMRGGDIKGGQVGYDLPFVSPEKSNEYSRTILKRDDVVIALVGYPGEAAKVPARLEGANISRAVGLLRSNELIDPNYLVSYLNSPVGRRLVLAPSAGSAQLVVNLAALNKLEFPLPPLPEQSAIAEALGEMDAELAGLAQRREKTRALKQGMMQELLTGRTRLISAEEPHA